MQIQITCKTALETFEHITLSTHGDDFERNWASFIDGKFPSYTTIWKMLVFPFRASCDQVFLSMDLPRSHEALCIYNYSLMRTLVKLERIIRDAQKRKKEHGDTSTDLFDDLFTRLVTGYDQLDHFLSAFYACAILNSAGDGIMLRRWKEAPGFGKKSSVWYKEQVSDDIAKSIKASNNRVRAYRHNIVHGPKWPGWLDRIPKTSKIDDQLYWSDWLKFTMDTDHFERDTVDRFEAMEIAYNDFTNELDSFHESLAVYLNSRGTVLPNQDLALLNSVLDGFDNTDGVGASASVHSTIFRFMKKNKPT